MKTIYTLTLLVFLGTNLFAQSIANNRVLHKASKNDTVKPIYDSICEWAGVAYAPPPGAPPYFRTSDFIYDANGNLLSDVLQQNQYYSGYPAAFLNVSKVSNTYSSNNLISTSITQSWNNSAWVNSSQNIYSYTASDSINTVKTQQWKSNTWVDTTLTTYYYNSNNLDSCMLIQAWNGSTWVNYSHCLYYYNASNTDTGTMQQTWNDTTATWINQTKYSYIYNIGNLDSIMTNGFWWGNVWDSYYKDFYTYDTNNNLTYCSFWDDNAGWINVGGETYTYDAENRLVSSLWRFQPTHYDNTYYYYHTAGTNEINPVISVYPNPSALNFTIDNGSKSYTNCTIEVYNMLGQNVYKTNWESINTPLQISLNDASGIYILRFSSDQGTFHKKLEINKSLK